MDSQITNNRRSLFHRQIYKKFQKTCLAVLRGYFQKPQISCLVQLLKYNECFEPDKNQEQIRMQKEKLLSKIEAIGNFSLPKMVKEINQLSLAKNVLQKIQELGIVRKFLYDNEQKFEFVKQISNRICQLRRFCNCNSSLNSVQLKSLRTIRKQWNFFAKLHDYLADLTPKIFPNSDKIIEEEQYEVENIILEKIEEVENNYIDRIEWIIEICKNPANIRAGLFQISCIISDPNLNDTKFDENFQRMFSYVFERFNLLIDIHSSQCQTSQLKKKYIFLLSECNTFLRIYENSRFYLDCKSPGRLVHHYYNNLKTFFEDSLFNFINKLKYYKEEKDDFKAKKDSTDLLKLLENFNLYEIYQFRQMEKFNSQSSMGCQILLEDGEERNNDISVELKLLNIMSSSSDSSLSFFLSQSSFTEEKQQLQISSQNNLMIFEDDESSEKRQKLELMTQRTEKMSETELGYSQTFFESRFYEVDCMKEQPVNFFINQFEDQFKTSTGNQFYFPIDPKSLLSENNHKAIIVHFVSSHHQQNEIRNSQIPEAYLEFKLDSKHQIYCLLKTSFHSHFQSYEVLT